MTALFTTAPRRLTGTKIGRDGLLEDDKMSTRGGSPAQDEAKPPTLKKGWRLYTGMATLGLSCILPLGAVAVPWLGLPAAHSVVLAGALVAGGPEVLCVIAIALLGKDTFQYFTYKAKAALRRAVGDRPVSKTQYYIGLTIILLSWVPAYLFAYLPAAMPDESMRIYILAATDLAFVASAVLMGGEFWEKVRRIFIYEGKAASP
jgi:hypothetical protein